jgi:hypothetical protein
MVLHIFARFTCDWMSDVRATNINSQYHTARATVEAAVQEAGGATCMSWTGKITHTGCCQRAAELAMDERHQRVSISALHAFAAQHISISGSISRQQVFLEM